MSNYGLNEKLLSRLYLDLGKSDKEISEFIGMDRTTISKLRKDFGIPTKKTLHDRAERFVIRKLLEKGYKIQNLRSKDKTSLYHLLVNKKIRVDIKSATLHGDCFRFYIADGSTPDCVESTHRIKLPNGRTKKLYRKTCHYIIFVGFTGDKVVSYIIPSNYLPDDMQTLTIPFNKNSDYLQFKSKWGLLNILES